MKNKYSKFSLVAFALVATSWLTGCVSSNPILDAMENPTRVYVEKALLDKLPKSSAIDMLDRMLDYNRVEKPNAVQCNLENDQFVLDSGKAFNLESVKVFRVWDFSKDQLREKTSGQISDKPPAFISLSFSEDNTHFESCTMFVKETSYNTDYWSKLIASLLVIGFEPEQVNIHYY